MAIQSQIFPISTDGETTFTSTKHIATKQHAAVWLFYIATQEWNRLSSNDYDIVNNTVVLDNGLVSSIVSQLELRVADSEDELGSSLSDIALVASFKDNIDTVAEDIDNVNIVANDKANVDKVANSIDNVDKVSTNINNVNITANAISGGGTTVGGQFTGGGLTKPLIYTSKIVTEDTTIVNGTNALAIDTLEVADGVELTIADGSVIKVI